MTTKRKNIKNKQKIAIQSRPHSTVQKHSKET